MPKECCEGGYYGAGCGHDHCTGPRDSFDRLFYFRSGAMDYWSGVKKCPYPKGSREEHAWLLGYKREKEGLQL